MTEILKSGISESEETCVTKICEKTFRSTWQDTQLKCAWIDEMEILCRLEDDNTDDEV